MTSLVTLNEQICNYELTAYSLSKANAEKLILMGFTELLSLSLSLSLYIYIYIYIYACIVMNVQFGLVYIGLDDPFGIFVSI